MENPNWSGIHSEARSWRSQLIGGLSEHYVIPRYTELFERYFKSSGAREFLELGSGNGDMAEAIRAKHFDFISRYVVSDNFSESVEWLKSKGFEAVQIDAQKISFPDKSFDAVLCFDVMHHVENPVQMAGEMMRVGKGKLFLTESNGLSLGRKLMELTPGHRRAGEKSYSARKYRSFFQQPGFRLLRFDIHPFVFPLYLPRVFLPAELLFNRIIERTPFLNWQCSNVYIYVEYEAA